MKEKKGFTLAEMLIAVAIIGILVAIAIPTFGHLVSDSERKACAINRSTMRDLILADLAFEDEGAAINSVITSHANESQCPDSKETYVCMVDSGVLNVTCNTHGETTSVVIDSSTNENTVTDASGALNDALNDLAITINSGGQIDSTATSGEKTQQINQYLQDNFPNSNIKSWVIFNTSGTKVLHWTSIDVSTCENGDRVPVMRYNPRLQTYTVGYATIVKKTVGGSSYMAIYSVENGAQYWTEYGKKGGTAQNDTTKASFDTTEPIFEEAYQNWKNGIIYT